MQPLKSLQMPVTAKESDVDIMAMRVLEMLNSCTETSQYIKTQQIPTPQPGTGCSGLQGGLPDSRYGVHTVPPHIPVHQRG